MKMMLTLFTVGIMFCAGASAKIFIPLSDPVKDHVLKELLGLKLLPEDVEKWGGLVQELNDTYRAEGAESQNVHHLLARLVIQILADKGLIKTGYPAGKPFPSQEFQYVRFYDYVIIIDKEKQIYVVPYDKSYDGIVSNSQLPASASTFNAIAIAFAQAFASAVANAASSASVEINLKI